MASRSEAAVTLTWLEPSWVLSRRRAVLAAVGFSKLTAYDLLVSSWDLGVRVRSEILPLGGC